MGDLNGRWIIGGPNGVLAVAGEDRVEPVPELPGTGLTALAVRPANSRADNPLPIVFATRGADGSGRIEALEPQGRRRLLVGKDPATRTPGKAERPQCTGVAWGAISNLAMAAHGTVYFTEEKGHSLLADRGCLQIRRPREGGTGHGKTRHARRPYWTYERRAKRGIAVAAATPRRAAPGGPLIVCKFLENTKGIPSGPCARSSGLQTPSRGLLICRHPLTPDGRVRTVVVDGQRFGARQLTLDPVSGELYGTHPRDCRVRKVDRAGRVWLVLEIGPTVSMPDFHRLHRPWITAMAIHGRNLLWIDAWYDAVQILNLDRGTLRTLIGPSEPMGCQPGPIQAFAPSLPARDCANLAGIQALGGSREGICLITASARLFQMVLNGLDRPPGKAP